MARRVKITETGSLNSVKNKIVCLNQNLERTDKSLNSNKIKFETEGFHAKAQKKFICFDSKTQRRTRLMF